MKIAVFSDVHSNFEALKAVLEDIKLYNPDKILCLGDLVGYGASPNEVVELIREESIATVMGNYDEAVGFRKMVCGCDYKTEEEAMLGGISLSWTSENIKEENREFLKNLPRKVEFEAEGYKILAVHGSPERTNEYLFEDTSPERLIKFFEENHCHIVLCGHTHIPYVKTLKDRFVINAGSVGKPKPEQGKNKFSKDATWVFMEIKPGELTFKIMKVPYDFEKSAGLIEERGLPKLFANLVRGIA